MDSYVLCIPVGFLWVPTGFWWIPMDSYRSRTDSYEIPMDSFGFLAILMDSFGVLCIPMHSFGIPTDSYGFLRIPVDSYGFLLEFLWIIMEFSQLIQLSVELLGFSGFLYNLHCIPVEFNSLEFVRILVEFL